MFKSKTPAPIRKSSDSDPNICGHAYRDETEELEVFYPMSHIAVLNPEYRLKVNGRCRGCGILFLTFKDVPCAASAKIFKLQEEIEDLKKLKDVRKK